MRTAPFEWTFCGEHYRICFFPLTARFEVRAPDGDWVKLVERHRPTIHARWVTIGLPNALREQFLSALELQRTEERAGLAQAMPRRARGNREAA